MVKPEDVANLVLFRVSDKASAITGQTIGIDGGAGRGIQSEAIIPWCRDAAGRTIHLDNDHRYRVLP